jgi:hypothetical protein
MVGNARFVNAKLLTRKLGVTEINIVLNIFARFVSPKYGLKHKVKTSFQSTRFSLNRLEVSKCKK